MITFRRIPTVAVGDPVTHTEMVALADGINDRIRSGLGDPTRRIHYYLAAHQRQIRNPDAGGFLYPKVDEARSDYEHVGPRDGEWPFTGPGEPEGVNVSATLGTYVFGAEAIGVLPEDERLSVPALGGLDLNPGTGTARDYWELAKRQRGAFDASTGAVASPSFAAAQSHFGIIQSSRSPHGNAYGGFQPTPEYLGECSDGDSETLPTPHYALIFTPVADGLPVLNFEGFCPEEPTHVARILYYPGDRYVIVQYDGTVTELAWSDYIEGPYTFGNRLTKTWGNHISRVQDHFVRDFSGTPAQKDSEDAGLSPWLSHAFATHEFLTRQYHLAPQFGQDMGEDTVAPIYPQWTLSGATVFPAGEAAVQAGGLTEHATPAGCLTTGFLIHAQELLGGTTLEIRDGEEVLAIVALSNSTPSVLHMLGTPRRFAALNFRLASRAQFATPGSSAGILIEATDLYEYKPRLHDMALLLRLGGSTIEVFNGTDGSGLDEDLANEIGDGYFATGCITNRRGHVALPGSDAQINSNAIFDAARRQARQCSRVIPRPNLVGYEVADGKSILYFSRLWSDVSTADVFDGIAPAREPVIKVRWGIEYVASGEVVYAGQKYTDGQKFTGKKDVPDVQGSAFEADGIMVDAPPQGWSNEWVLDVAALVPYSDLETSSWKIDAFADYVGTFFDRCTWLPNETRPANLTNHFAYGERSWVSPESLPGFRYAPSINRINCGDPGTDLPCEEERRRALRSCPIGHLPYVVESVESYTEDGEERVKVTLATRLHHGSDAPSSVDADISTWVWSDFHNEIESGRTEENGIREYLMREFVGGRPHHCAGQGDQWGNAAHSSAVHLGLDVPEGACYPRFILTRLAPKPYVPQEGDPTTAATPMVSWPFGMMEIYARAMCEGYVDGISTERYGCETGTYAVLDMTFEAACFQAFGGRAFGVLPSVTTDLTQAADARADKPLFHGPIPNTYPSSEIFSQFAAFFNLLTDVRMMLPLKFQTQAGASTLTEAVKLYQADGTEWGCTTGQVLLGVDNSFVPKLAPEPTLAGWIDDTVCAAVFGMSIDDYVCDGSGDWLLNHNRTDRRYKWALFHDDYLEAVPPEWQDMIESNGLLLGFVETTIDWLKIIEVTPGDGVDNDCDGTYEKWHQGSNNHDFELHRTYTTECRLLPQSERLIAPLPPRGGVGVCRIPSGGDLIYCSRTASSELSITPIPADALVIRVQVVDP